MLELLRDRFGVPPSRMAIAGYAENAPVDTNDTEESRAHNRRVDLVLLTAGRMATRTGGKAINVREADNLGCGRP
jgi:hypothetical protein